MLVSETEIDMRLCSTEVDVSSRRAILEICSRPRSSQYPCPTWFFTSKSQPEPSLQRSGSQVTAVCVSRPIHSRSDPGRGARLRAPLLPYTQLRSILTVEPYTTTPPLLRFTAHSTLTDDRTPLFPYYRTPLLPYTAALHSYCTQLRSTLTVHNRTPLS